MKRLTAGLGWAWRKDGPLGVLVMLWVNLTGQAAMARARRAALLNRLHWVMATSRNGGYWQDVGYRKNRMRPYGPGGPVIAVERQAMRWVQA